MSMLLVHLMVLFLCLVSLIDQLVTACVINFVFMNMWIFSLFLTNPYIYMYIPVDGKEQLRSVLSPYQKGTEAGNEMINFYHCYSTICFY